MEFVTVLNMTIFTVPGKVNNTWKLAVALQLIICFHSDVWLRVHSTALFNILFPTLDTCHKEAPDESLAGLHPVLTGHPDDQ